MSTRILTCRTPGCTAPDDFDHHSLHSASTDNLILGVIRLTHQIHDEWVQEQADRLRHQRNIISSEILRRTEHQS